MVLIRWLFFVFAISLLILDIIIARKTTNLSAKLLENNRRIIHNKPVQTKEETPKTESKVNKNSRSALDHQFDFSRQRKVRSLRNTTRNETGNLPTNKPFTISKASFITFKPVTLKFEYKLPPKVKTVTPQPEVNFTAPEFEVFTAPTTKKPFTIPKGFFITFKPVTLKSEYKPLPKVKTVTPQPVLNITAPTFEVFTARPLLHEHNVTLLPRFRRTPNCPKTPYTCSRRCSKQTYFVVRYTEFECNCDSACNDVFMDCCSDFEKECSKRDVNDTVHDVVYLRRSSWRCESLKVTRPGCSKRKNLWMISRCPSHWLNDDTKIKCHSAATGLDVHTYDSFVPVVGSSDNLTYRNQYCAKCNNVSKFEFMTLIFKKETVPPPYFTAEELAKFIAKNKHNFESVEPRAGQNLRWCNFTNLITSCPVTASNVERDACANRTVALVEGRDGKVFKSKDCALCNGEKLSCGLGQNTKSCYIAFRSIVRGISLRDYGVSLETNTCPRDQVYDPYLGKCRDEVTELEKNDTNKYEVILSVLKLQAHSNYGEPRFITKSIAEYFKMNVFQITTVNITNMKNKDLVTFTLDLTPVQSLIVASDPEFTGNSNDTIGLRRLFKFKKAFQLYVSQYGHYTVYKLSVRQLSCIHHHVYKMAEYTILEDLRIQVNSSGVVYGQSEYYLKTKNNITTAAVCLKLVPSTCNGSYIKLNSSEYRLFDNLTLSYGSLVYDFGEYYYKDGMVLICTPFQQSYTSSFKREPKDDLALIVLTWLGFVLSILGLSALLVTYAIFRDLRTLPGKNLMSLAVSLCLAEVLWLCGSAVDINETSCIAIAIANHYFFLVFFAKSSVIAFHSCLIFGKQIAVRGSASEDNKTFLVYSIVAWVLPAVFVLTFALLDHHRVFITDYGRSELCWLGTRDSKLFLFIVPFAAFLLFNLLLFSFVVYRLYNNQKSSAHSLGRVAKQRQIQNVWICVKLSTLMALSWLFGLLEIAVETKTDVFAYLFVVFVSFQGLFICVAFLFKRTNYRLYSSLITKNFNRSSSKGGRTTIPERQNISKNVYQDSEL